MKKNIVFLLFSFLICSLYAQKELLLQGNEADLKISGTELIRIKSQSSIPAYIRFYQGREVYPKNIDLFLQKLILPSEQHTLTESKRETDMLGYTHIRYQQYVNGYLVEGSMYSAHIREGKVYSFHGDLFDKIPLNVYPSISHDQAFDQALAYVDADTYKWELENYSGLEELDYIYQQPKGELVFAPVNGDFQKGDFRLAFKFDIYAHQPHSRTHTYVDARSGEVIWQLNQLHTSDVLGTAETKYSGVQEITTDSTADGFRLREEGRGNGIWTLNLREDTNPNFTVDFLDEDNYWSNVNENHDEVATDAHFGAEKMYDYLLETYGRNSIDGNGFRLTSLVHYGENVFNAFWNGNMAGFGDGNNGNALTTLDVVAHEFTHGLTDFTGNLIYQNESGALNESFSDIFGVAVERYATPQEWNWLIGEQLGSTLRSMSNPNQFNDPKNYQGNLWFTGTGDNGGVHINSGVQNHWFHILVEGDRGNNDFGNTFEVDALGFDKAAAIAFRNLTVYMTPSSQYTDARFYASLSAAELYGACTPEVEATTNAWYAVGVGEPYEPRAVSGFNTAIVSNCAAPFSITFQNRSQNANDFVWDFGDGNSSTAVNPTYTYADSGSYDITLIASGGECGTDTSSAFSVVNISSKNACLMTAELPDRDNCSGTLLDSGGGDQDYGDLTDYVVTIAPTDAYKVNLQFTDFEYEENYDYLIIYDGPDTNSTVIGRYTGAELPNAGRPIRSSGNSITIRQTSDPFVTGRGFALDWFCSLPLPPEASFATLDTANCNGYVRFIDESFQAEAWLWDFGDGTQSTEQDPIHFYEEAGTYTVNLVAVNEFGQSTASRTDYITIGDVEEPIVADIFLCEDNGTTLTADVIGEGSLNWYNEEGTLIQPNSNSLQVFVNSGETTFFVEKEIPAPKSSAGPVSPDFGTGGIHDNNSTQYLIFSTYEEITIDSVWVNSSANRQRTIQLWDSAGRVLSTRTLNIPAGYHQIELNFEVPQGNSFRIGGSQMGFFRNNSGPSYPYRSDNGVMQITGSSAGPSYYYYFYDWSIRGASCKSDQVALKVNRQEGPRPVAGFEYSAEGRTLTFTDQSTDAASWFWNFGDNTLTTSQNPSHEYAEAGEYTVTLIVSNGGTACNDTIEQVVKVNNPTNIDGELDGASVNLFPNPGQGLFTLEVSPQRPSDIQMTVFNPIGQEVYATQARRSAQFTEQINLRGLAPATYLVRIRVNNRVAFRKYILK